jgi:hypothetical protein
LHHASSAAAKQSQSSAAEQQLAAVIAERQAKVAEKQRKHDEMMEQAKKAREEKLAAKRVRSVSDSISDHNFFIPFCAPTNHHLFVNTSFKQSLCTLISIDRLQAEIACRRAAAEAASESQQLHVEEAVKRAEQRQRELAEKRAKEIEERKVCTHTGGANCGL